VSRVSVVLHVSQPTVAGVPRVVETLARDQVESGWQVHVACPSDGYLADRLAGSGVHVHVWEATRGPGPSVARETSRLRAIVREAEPAVVHLHSSKAGLAGRLAVRGRTPTVFQPHSWSFQAVDGPMRTASLAWERWASRWTSAVICVSDDEASQGRAARVRSDTRVIPNGIDVPADVAPEPSAARAALALPERPTAVCLGRLARQKGQDRLLRLWPEVLRTVPGAMLVLVGEGPDRACLETLAAETGGVYFAGHQDDVFPWLAAADVVVLPSRWEAGLTLAAMEAMAVGRSVVATEFEGMEAGLPEGAGQVVAHDDDAALRDALVPRLLDAPLARDEGEVGRRFVTTSCRPATTTAAVRSLYADVARESA
jgi:glycosyltransferase involved in cell wall biosynthesis